MESQTKNKQSSCTHFKHDTTVHSNLHEALQQCYMHLHVADQNDNLYFTTHGRITVQYAIMHCPSVRCRYSVPAAE